MGACAHKRVLRVISCHGYKERRRLGMCDVTSVTPPGGGSHQTARWRCCAHVRAPPGAALAAGPQPSCAAHKSHRTCNATGPRGCCDSELSRVNIHMHICRPQRHYNAHEWRYPPPGEQHWAWCEVTPSLSTRTLVLSSRNVFIVRCRINGG